MITIIEKSAVRKDRDCGPDQVVDDAKKPSIGYGITTKYFEIFVWLCTDYYFINRCK